MSKTNKENIDKSTAMLYRGECNLHSAAEHCGLTPKELKLIFTEFVKHNPPIYRETNG